MICSESWVRNLEDLPDDDDDQELECQRSAPQAVLLNSVLRKSLEGLPVHHHHFHDPELVSMICSTVCCCSKAKDTTVGTSTNCSAICGQRKTERGWILKLEILGTAITCSTGVYVSTSFKMSASTSSFCSAPRVPPPWPCGAVWCVASARALATLIRAYRKHARRRRSLRRLAGSRRVVNASHGVDH